jgi:uncharacterized Ntn-hydrolase superfamily protein
VTISIVARDAGSGRFGVATAAFELAVGATVPLVTGHGAIAVQACSPVTWGPVVLAALGSGVRAVEAVALLRAFPPARRAQVAVVDRDGGVAVLSGPDLETAAGADGRDGVCAAAHRMERPGVARIAVRAYVTSPATTFEGRLLDALSMADRMGSDVRGRRSAALRIVPRDGADRGDGDPALGGAIDLRVDDAHDPVGELRRLHGLWAAHTLLKASRGVDGLYRDADLALAALAEAPDDLTCLGGAALALVRADRLEEAIGLLRRLTAREPRTPSRIHRLIHSGLLGEKAGRAALRALLEEADRTAPSGLPLLRPTSVDTIGPAAVGS